MGRKERNATDDIPASVAEVVEGPEERAERKRKRREEKAARKAADVAEVAGEGEEETEEQKERKERKRRRKEEKGKAQKATSDPATPPAAIALSKGDAKAFEDVQVTGAGDGTEVAQWRSFEDARSSFGASVVDYLKATFSRPTPVQASCWPILCQNRDCIGIAQTGSGKTLAFLLPALAPIVQMKGLRPPPKGPYLLVVAPTRELAQQIQKEAQKAIAGAQLTVHTAAVFGGVPRTRQAAQFRKVVDILVACPGRLNDYLGTETVSIANCARVVLDEADRMLDMGFEPQIRKILKHVPEKRHTMLFSATWPEEVRGLAAELLKEPVRVVVGDEDDKGFHGNADVAQQFFLCEVDEQNNTIFEEKMKKLTKILKKLPEADRCLVFVNTKKMAQNLSEQVQRRKKLNCWCLHGDMSQEKRVQAMDAFRSGECQILVATDIAARGLDVKDVKVVIQFDPAVQVEDYVHRVGRTGRAGSKGVAWTFMGKNDIKAAKDAAKILNSCNHEVPEDIAALAAKPLDNWKARAARRYFRGKK